MNGELLYQKRSKNFSAACTGKISISFLTRCLGSSRWKNISLELFLFFSEKGRKKKGNRNLFEDLKSEKIVDETNFQIVVLGEVKHICF